MKIEDLEKALQYFVIAVPESEEQAKAYFWARKALTALRIDRRAWTAEWVPTTDDDGCVWLKCSACEYDLDSMEESNPFCPSCGRAMTEEAWAELKRRVRR